MAQEFAVKVKNVSKSFKIPTTVKPNTFKGYFLSPFKKIAMQRFVALKNLSFNVKKGEFFSIIGRNGAGKSTLLKIIAGIYFPDQGVVEIDGHLVPFLELGVGFHPDLSARENVYLNGIMLGLSRSEVEQDFEEIFQFAGLEEFKEVPIKNFSSGMTVRLAFSVAVKVKSDILVLDEVLAVGDAEFQEKCYKYFDSIKGTKTIIYVSHDLASVKRYSDRVLYLKEGNEYEVGGAERMVAKYQSKVGL